ncbi:hypothetical protein ACFVZD_06790 [Streptomyces sp. NPDC058287]|uniref:hypothetical protein n=1 Tax=unclassified Streptomyces TaxID=2593676 RepID=UPI0036DFCE63
MDLSTDGQGLPRSGSTRQQRLRRHARLPKRLNGRGGSRAARLVVVAIAAEILSAG